ncbi:MAG: PKD domain-containing protein [Cryomorphaceae bacterium]|jgi:gliding motility-associated-like protein|nr:PKD domain-containing protein [Cryomorphaceae bacterium]
MKYYLFLILLFGISQFFAQNNAGCPNANFSSSNFSNWQGYTGNYGNPASAVGIVNGRHTIITTPGVDPNTCGGLQMIPPGSTRSARLGNQSTGSQGERLTYTINVTAQNSLFIYKYAVVLQDPGHSPAQQPVFQMRLLNQNGTQIGGNCGQYSVYSGQPGQNFQTCSNRKWLPWTIVGINLQAYIGQNVTIEFTTKDCSLGGHYGYAYVVADCMPLTLDLDYCFGSPTINISGPAGFQSYNWSNGANTQSISVPAATAAPSYTVTMQSFSNQGSCTVALTASAIPTTVQSNFTYTAACPWTPMQFNSTPTILPNTINGVLLANGGASSWSWNFGDGSTLNGNNPAVHMNPTHTYQNPGTYNVTHIVTTQAGCSDTITQSITVLPPPVINFSFNNSCMNDTVSFSNQTQDPNLAQVTYTWIFGNGIPNSTQTNPIQIFPNAGTFNVSLIASNAGGCTDTLTQAVTIYPLPPVNAGNNVSVCPGNLVTLTAAGAPSLTWETGTANGGTYLPINNITLTVVGIDNNGCVNQDSMDVTIYPGALVNAGPDINVCLGSTVTITATGSNTYQWNNGITNGQTFTPPLGTTTYTVIGTSANGCTNVDSMVLTVFSNPGISAGPDQIVCAGDSTQLLGQGAVSYQWSGGVSNGTYFIPLSTGLWSVTGLDANGCIGYDTLQIIVPQPVVFAGNDTSICPGFSIPLNAVGTATYTWSTGTLNGNNYSPLSNDMLTVVGLDTNNCAAYDTLLVTIYPTPVVDAGPDIQVCSGTSVTIVGSGAVNYQWDNGLINGNTWIPPVGVVSYHLIGTDGNGCIDTSDMVLTVWANPVVNAGVDQSICEGSSTQVNASGAVTYQWNNNVQNQVNFTPLQSSTYSVVGTDQNGCVGTDNLIITIEPAAYPNFVAPVTADCLPFSASISNISTGTPYLSALWDFGNGMTSTDMNTTSVTYNAPGCYDVSLSLTTALGCVWDTTFNDYLCAYPVPFADFSINPQTMTVLNTTGTFSNYSSSADTYEWDFGDGSSTSNEFEPIHSFPTSSSGNYLITLVASTNFGCTDTATRTVMVQESQLIFVPNTFTPDGNEYNQTWLPIITADFDPYEYSCFIYNRWGAIIWENHNHEIGWDGKDANGFDITQGTYTWKIILKSPYSDNRKAYVGHLNLLR